MTKTDALVLARQTIFTTGKVKSGGGDGKMIPTDPFNQDVADCYNRLGDIMADNFGVRDDVLNYFSSMPPNNLIVMDYDLNTAKQPWWAPLLYAASLSAFVCFLMPVFFGWIDNIKWIKQSVIDHPRIVFFFLITFSIMMIRTLFKRPTP
jgi:hypothetical protein